jgi:hypothetical protein
MEIVRFIFWKLKCGDLAPISGSEAFKAEEKDEKVWEVLDKIHAVGLDSTLVVVPPHICHII